jgi:hypothetical protein
VLRSGTTSGSLAIRAARRIALNGYPMTVMPRVMFTVYLALIAAGLVLYTIVGLTHG